MWFGSFHITSLAEALKRKGGHNDNFFIISCPHQKSGLSYQHAPDNQSHWRLVTPKQLEIHERVISTVAIDVLVQKHQPIGIHSDN